MRRGEELLAPPSAGQLHELLSTAEALGRREREPEGTMFVYGTQIRDVMPDAALGLNGVYKAVSARIGRVDRMPGDHRYALWAVSLFELYEANGTRQNTAYNFRWDEQRTYLAEKKVMTTQQNPEVYDYLDNLSQLESWAAVQPFEQEIRYVSSADCEALLSQTRQYTGIAQATARALRR